MDVSCHRHFFPVLLMNQQWPPPLSTFRIMCDVPSIAVFCSESVECFPGTVSKYFFNLLVTIPVAPIISGTIVHFRFHIRCVSVHKLLYFNFFSAYYYYYYDYTIFVATDIEKKELQPWKTGAKPIYITLACVRHCSTTWLYLSFITQGFVYRSLFVEQLGNRASWIYGSCDRSLCGPKWEIGVHATCAAVRHKSNH